MKQLKIRICPNGLIQAETEGIKGKACRSYVGILEQLTGARAVDSEYTPEYYEQQNGVEEVSDLTVGDKYGN